jgi:hypothetical protein
MDKASITIPVDPQTARAYDSAAPNEKRKIQVLLTLWLQELTSADAKPLEQVLEEVGRRAKERGLTQELLDSLLKDA